MKLLYATSITLPSYRANRLQVLAMARAFAKRLENDFVLGLSDAPESERAGLSTVIRQGRSFTLAWRYLSFAKRYGVTHVYCREEKLLFFMILFNRLFFRLPLSFWYELHHLIYREAWWFTYLLRAVSGVVSITRAMERVFLDTGYPQEKMIVAADAVALSAFDLPLTKDAARMELGLKSGKKFVIYTGTIHEPWKGVGTLYEAAKLVGEECQFLIVGGKPHYVEYFRSLHPDLPHFRLLGHKPHREIARYLKAADLAVLPNSGRSDLSRVSTSPLKMFEYMAADIPILASDLPPIREILNEENAFFVAPDDPEALARAIQGILKEPEEAARRAGNARRAAQAHTWDARAEKILSFIQ